MAAFTGGEYQQSHNATSCSDNPRVLWFGIGAVYIIPLPKQESGKWSATVSSVRLVAGVDKIR